MANSDYVINGHGNFAGVARLSSTVGLGDTKLYFDGFRTNGAAPAAGDALMIGREFMRIDEFTSGHLIVARGCMDSVPRAHMEDAAIWFLKNGVGSNKVIYAEGESIGVKPLPAGVSKPALPLAAVPPQGVTFNGRFNRPYPPGNVCVNAVPFHEADATLDAESASLGFTWAHRDRIAQADQLVGHSEGDVGPEPGTTYLLKMYRYGEPRALVRQYEITGTGFLYTYAAASADFGEPVSEADMVFAPEGLAVYGSHCADYAVKVGSHIYAVGYASSSSQVRKLNATTLETVAGVYAGSQRVSRMVHGASHLFVSDLAAVGETARVRKFDMDLNLVGTTMLASSADGWGMTFVAGALWVSMQYAGKLRKINPTTLETIADYSIHCSMLTTDGTHVYATSLSSDGDIYKINPATGAIVSTITTVDGVLDCAVCGANLWVLTATVARAYALADGAFVAGSEIALTGEPWSHRFGNVSVAGGNLLLGRRWPQLIDGTTFEQLAAISLPEVDDRRVTLSLIEAERALIQRDDVLDYYSPEPVIYDPAPLPPVQAVLNLVSKRDGVESLMGYTIRFDLQHTNVQPFGLGYRLGQSLGGIAP